MWPNLPHRAASLRSPTNCLMQSPTCSHIFACRCPAYLHVVGPLWARTDPIQRGLMAFLRPYVSDLFLNIYLFILESLYYDKVYQFLVASIVFDLALELVLRTVVVLTQCFSVNDERSLTYPRC